MALQIRVAHDFVCPWCWIGLNQVRRLQREFDVEIEWVGYELYPEELDFPEGDEACPLPPPGKAPTPTRLDLAYAAEGMVPPRPDVAWPSRTHLAHEAVEYAKQFGCDDLLVGRLYEAFWIEGKRLDDQEVVRECVEGLVPDPDAMMAQIALRPFKHRIIGFDEPAHANGIYNVPTFCIGSEKLAEQPYTALRDAVGRHLTFAEPASVEVYPALSFPPAQSDRPYILLNMVSTLDGKIISGERDEPVGDLGSALDHRTMHAIEDAAGAVLIGAGSLRATPKFGYTSGLKRFVMTRSGDVDATSDFFAGDHAYVIVPRKNAHRVSDSLQVIIGGEEEIELAKVIHHLRSELGITRLLLEGGSEINALFFTKDWVDEVFLTLAPKIKLGDDVPTLAGGAPLPREALRQYELVSCEPYQNELFLRYRRAR